MNDIDRMPDPSTLADAYYSRLETKHDPTGRYCYECQHCYIPHPPTEIPQHALRVIVGDGVKVGQLAGVCMNLIGTTAMDCSWCSAMNEFISATERACGCEDFRLDETAGNS